MCYYPNEPALWKITANRWWKWKKHWQYFCRYSDIYLKWQVYWIVLFNNCKSASWSWLSGINNLATCQMIPIIANTYIGQKVIIQWKKLIFTAQFHLLYMKSLQKLNRLVEKTEKTWYRYLIYIRDTDGQKFSQEARIDSTWQVPIEHTYPRHINFS